MNAVERLLGVLKHQPVDRVPVVGVTSVVTADLMRQVGTRWPDAHHDAEQMVRAGAAAHVVCGLETVKLPFDMTVEAGALGAEIDYGGEAALPKVRTPPFASPEQLAFGDDLVARGRFPVVLEAIRIARRKYGDSVPLVSSMLGPFTLLGSLFGVETLLIWMMEEPETVRGAMTTATRLVARYAAAQFAAGAHVVQIGEPTASGDLISPGQYLEHVAPFHREIASTTDLPLIIHICGNITRHLPHVAAVGFRGVSFDVKTDIAAARSHLKGKVALIGYVPTSLLREGSPREVGEASRQCLREGVDALNAGCAVAPDTPLDNIRAMIAAAQGA
ncbi:MAG TPA: MtaA/CmuA family methyltransferase [Candidatus Sulfotelmatobacter sp.]|nr:MtaA/CmuA family methyltransferase [Candidatus Sulfotelmatobacter sp.]